MSVSSTSEPIAGNSSAEFIVDAALRKVTWRIVPFLFLCYVVSFLDRINVGFAQLKMSQDLGFSDAMYGAGVAVFYIGYVLFEVPSNMLLARIGARRTFTRIMLLWGLGSVSMMFVENSTHFYLLRFLLGVFEAGFFPGIVLYLTYWFPANKRAGVMSVFFAGVAVAGVLGGLLSGWIMRDMDGVGGLSGWRWMFMLEGMPAVLLAICTYFFLVDKPASAKWLSRSERTWLAQACEPEHNHVVEHGTAAFMQALKYPYVYLFAFIYFSVTCAALTLNFWMPLMIRGFGVQDVVSVSLYTTIPNLIGAIGLIPIARHSDRTGERRWHFAICAVVGGLALWGLTLHPDSLAVSLALLSLAAMTIFAALPIFWAVPSAYLSSNAAPAGLALISSIGITSGVVGPWAIGHLRTATGNMDLAVYVLAVLLCLCSVAMLFGVKARIAR